MQIARLQVPTSLEPIQASQLHAPAENINYFQQLLSGLRGTLTSGQTALTEKTSNPVDTELLPDPAPSLLAASAEKVNKAEYYIQRLGRQIQGGIDQLQFGNTMDGNFPRAIIQQQFASAYYFLGVNRVGNTAEDITEDIASITRRR